MSTPSTPTKARVIHCLKSDCNVTFHDSDLLYLHFAHAHHQADAPKPVVNEALAMSLKKFIEEKRKQFKKPPRKMELEEETLFACHDETCEQTFTSELLRDFHVNRMHHSRHPSLLSQLAETEEEEEQRRHGYECIKADCDGRFLSAELRDFHCSRVHPMLWKATQDIQQDMITRDEDRDAGKHLLGVDMATDFNTITPLAEISEMTFTSEPESDATSICESDDDIRSKEVNILISPATETGVEETREETVVEALVDALVIKVDIVDTSPIKPAMEYTTETVVVAEEIQITRRSIFQYRSRSDMVMNRNALANPGASKWVVRY